jgi:DNA repair protein RecO (recombination protein O)
MFIHYRSWAFVLGSKEIGESDRLIYFFTRDYGLLEVLGKAIRKVSSKLKHGSQDFCFGEIEFIQGKRFKILTDVYLVKNPNAIKKDLRKLRTAYAISDLILEFVKQPEKDKNLWNLLEVSLRLTGAWQKNVYLIYQFFLWNFLKIIGFGLDFTHCFACEKKFKPAPYFIFTNQGIVCSQCAPILRKKRIFKISQQTLKILRVMEERDLELLGRLKFKPEVIKELKVISNYYLNFIRKKSVK